MTGSVVLAISFVGSFVGTVFLKLTAVGRRFLFWMQLGLISTALLVTALFCWLYRPEGWIPVAHELLSDIPPLFLIALMGLLSGTIAARRWRV